MSVDSPGGAWAYQEHHERNWPLALFSLAKLMYSFRTVYYVVSAVGIWCAEFLTPSHGFSVDSTR